VALILSVVETRKGVISQASLGALEVGRQVASARGATLYAVMLLPVYDRLQQDLVAQLSAYRADRVILVTGVREPPCHGTWVRSLVEVVDRFPPAFLLWGASSLAAELAPYLGIHLKGIYAPLCTIDTEPQLKINWIRPGTRESTEFFEEDLENAVVALVHHGPRRPPAATSEIEVIAIRAGDGDAADGKNAEGGANAADGANAAGDANAADGANAAGDGATQDARLFSPSGEKTVDRTGHRASEEAPLFPVRVVPVAEIPYGSDTIVAIGRLAAGHEDAVAGWCAREEWPLLRMHDGPGPGIGWWKTSVMSMERVILIGCDPEEFELCEAQLPTTARWLCLGCEPVPAETGIPRVRFVSGSLKDTLPQLFEQEL